LDLRLYLRVIWRFRLVIVAGFILALMLSFLSYGRVGFKNGKPSISYRQDESWQSTTVLALTQGGFPWGRTVIPYNPQVTPSGTVTPPKYADPARFSGLSSYYSRLANSDAVQGAIERRTRHIRGTVTALPVVDNTYAQPFIQFSGFGSNPKDAVILANAGAVAFRAYLLQKQVAAGIPESQRVALATVNKARGAVLFAARRKTTPIVIFLTIMLAAIGLAFILENLRPRVQLVADRAEEREIKQREQRSA
jgi:hypothetical protein